MNIGVISYAFNRQMKAGTVDLFGYLETCRYRYRLSTADIWNGMLISLEDDYLAKVKDGLEERELTLVNLAVDGAHIWEDDPALRDEHHRRALANLHAAEVLGAKTVRIDAGSRREAWTPEEFDHIVMRYREYARRAEEHGYRIGPENHWGPERFPAELLRLCAAVDSPAFGILLHFERWSGEDAARGDELLAPYTMHTHIPSTLGDRLPAKMAMLRDTGYRGCWSVELVADNYTEVGVMLARIRNVLESWRQRGDHV
ncbi:MAG: TIM barrel protein [Chloroflexi bacterium]|nr:TIM barrel protein [Chloroflexota bacterium]